MIKKHVVMLGVLVGVVLLGYTSVSYFHLFPTASVDQTARPIYEDESEVQTTRPSFTEYSVPVSTEKLAALDLKSDPLGAEYKTYISDAYNGGVNFAGHYVIAMWGCGTNCRKGAIIDTHTGKILGALPFVAENGESFVATSTLFIENPPEQQEGAFATFPSRNWRWEPDRQTFTEIGSYIISKKSIEVAPQSKGNHTDPEWMWDADCQVIDNITVC